MSHPRYRSPHPARAELDSVRDAELAEEATRDSRDEAEWVNEVVILESTNESELTVARSLLEAGGIPCFTPGEEGQMLIGAGPMRLCVPIQHKERARALLFPNGPRRAGTGVTAQRHARRAEHPHAASSHPRRGLSR